MHLKTAKRLAKLISDYSDRSGGYSVTSRKLAGKFLGDFRNWGHDRPCEGAFLVGADEERAFWLVIVDWKKNGNYCLGVFPESKSSPLAKIHKCNGELDAETFLWKYRPAKKLDSIRNKERGKYFEAAYGSMEVLIAVPNDGSELEDFFAEVFLLAVCRQKADALDPLKPPSREGFLEGKRKERLHQFRERNPEVIRQAKQRALQQHGYLRCACCNFDFEKTYGSLGEDFIEGHHIIPVSTLHEDGEETRVEDIALVCSNCHRMLHRHRHRAWLGDDHLSELAKKIKSHSRRQSPASPGG